LKKAIVKLTSTTPMAQGKYHSAPKLERELPKDYEARTWKEKLHYDGDDIVYVSPMAIKNCLSETAKFLGRQIPGKGKSTYTKHFEAGIMIPGPMTLGIKRDDVTALWLFVPASGVRGDGKRVEKCFPVIHKWTGSVEAYITDEIITRDVFQDHFDASGKFIGLGSLRIRNNGIFGGFTAEVESWDSV
jgi:hypothetical protein